MSPPGLVVQRHPFISPVCTITWHVHTPLTDAFWSVSWGTLYKTTFTYSNGLPDGVDSQNVL